MGESTHVDLLCADVNGFVMAVLTLSINHVIKILQTRNCVALCVFQDHCNEHAAIDMNISSVFRLVTMPTHQSELKLFRKCQVKTSRHLKRIDVELHRNRQCNQTVQVSVQIFLLCAVTLNVSFIIQSLYNSLLCHITEISFNLTAYKSICRSKVSHPR